MADDEFYEEETEFDPGVDGGGTISPLQMLMGAGFSTVTPEGKAQATKVFEDLYGQRGAHRDEEQAAYDEYETRAREAREVLKRAREVLAAKKTPSTKWLEMAAGFGAPTRAGSFGESVANYAQQRIPGKHREQQFEADRDRQLLGFDTGMNTIDQQLAMQRLKLRQAGRTADDKLMIEAMKIMGKPTPQARAPARTPLDRTAEVLDKAYVDTYQQFVIKGGKAEAEKGLHEMETAGTTLESGRNDLSGPVVGLLPKFARDILFPKASETQEDVESTAMRTMKAVLGSQFARVEGENLLARVYNPRLPEAVNARRVKRWVEQMRHAYESQKQAAEYFEAHGTLRGFQGKALWSMADFEPPPVEEDLAWYEGILQEAKGLRKPVHKRPRPQAAAPDDGMEEIPIEALLPAHARGGRVKKKHAYAEGGAVSTAGEQLPDGRIRYTMPDGKKINARPGDSYEFALDVYTKATGSAPTRPGLPPQQIPPRQGVGEPAMFDDSVDDSAEVDAAMAQDAPDELPLGDVVLAEAPAAAGHMVAGAAAAGLADKVLPAIGDRLIPGRRETSAQRRVLDMMQEQRMTPAQLAANTRRTQALGIPAMAMDDPSMRLTAQSALAESGMPNATETLRRLKDRQDNIGERTTERVNKGLVPDEYFDQLDKLTEGLYENSKPLYQQAYAANPTVKSKVLPQLLDTPDGKKAVKNALRLMRNAGKKIGKQDAMGMVQSPSLEFLDNVKRGFDQLISKEEASGPTPLGKSMRDLRNALREELDLATKPAKGESLYKKAREQYAGDLEVLDALKSGRDDFTKLQPQEVQRLVKDMSFAEKDAFRTGVAQKLFETIDAPSGDVNSARRVIGSAANRKKLRQLFDSDKHYQIFEEALLKESELYDASKKAIARGEQGQELHAEPPDSPLKRAARHVPRLGWKSPTMWVLQFIRNNSVATEKKTDEILRYLKASTPDELTDLEKTLGPKLNRRISRKGRTGKVMAAGAALGAGAKALAEFEEDDDADQE